MSAGTITLDGKTLTLVTAQVPEHGRPLDEPVLIQEGLSHPGIDYERWRQAHLRFLPYRMDIMAAFPTYAAARQICRHFRNRHHILCRLAWTVSSESMTFASVKMPQPPVLRIEPGYVNGGGTSISGVAQLVFGSFILQHTERS